MLYCKTCPSKTLNKPCPSFLVIGGQKCGTTWISKILTQHYEVNNLKTKELHFFNNEKNFKKGEHWYFNHYRCNSNTLAVGEYTPNYLFCSISDNERIENNIPENIPLLVKQYNEDVKLIAILRNPVKRAISAYYHHINVGRISYKSKLKDVLNHYGILSMGYYALHLEKWFQHFKEDNFLILIYEEDLHQNNLSNTIKKVYSHIGVNPDYIPKNIEKRYNVSGSHFKLKLKNYFNDYLCKVFDIITPAFIKQSSIWNIDIHEEEINMLKAAYKPHNQRLSKLLDRELPW